MKISFSTKAIRTFLRGNAKNFILVAVGFVLAIVAVAYADPGHIAEKAHIALQPNSEKTTTVRAKDTATIVNNANVSTHGSSSSGRPSNVGSPSINKSSAPASQMATTSPSPAQTPAPAPHAPVCVYNAYTGAELTPGVRAQIGQLINNISWVASVSYSEYSDGTKYNISYNLENGVNLPESNIVSVSGVPGYYSLDGQPITVTNKPSSCP